MTRTSILEFRSFRSLPDRDVEPAIFFGNGLRVFMCHYYSYYLQTNTEK